MAKKEKKIKAKKQPKEKKQAPLVPEHKRPLICPPDGAGRGLAVRILGYACRCFVVMCLVWALMMFFGGAFNGAYEYSVCVSNGTMLGLALFATAVLGLICYNRYAALGGIALGAAGFALLSPNVVQGVLALYNGFLCRLYLSKYTMYLTNLGIGVPGLTSGEALAGYYKEQLTAYGADGMLVMALVLAAIFVPLVARKTRPVVPTLTCLVIIVPICTFNIAASNLGAGMLIASICAVLVMWAYDKMFRRAVDANKFDTKLQLFSEEGKPQYPEEYLQKLQAKQQKKEQKRLAKEAKKQKRKHKKEQTVDEELTDYFATKKSKTKPAKARLTDEEKKAQKAEKKQKKLRAKEVRRQVRRVRKYEQVTDSAKRAMGGFAAAMMLAVSFLIVIIPTVVVDDYMVIELLDEKISYVRAYVTAALMGDDERLDELEYELDKDNFQPHSTELEHLKFDGTQLFYIESQYAANLYLKGWIGVDYRDGAWYTGQGTDDPENPGAFEAWRELYGLGDLPSEQMFYNFYLLSHPELEIFEPGYDFLTKYHKYGDYGFVAMRVHMRRVNSFSSHVNLPSVTDPSRELYGYGNNEPSEHTFVNYFDGTLTGRDFAKAGTKYSAMVFAPIKTDKDWAETLGADIAYYNLQKQLILAYNSYEVEQMSYGPSITPTYTLKYEKDVPAKGLVTVSYRRSGKVVDSFVLRAEDVTYTAQESLVLRDANGGTYTISLDRNGKVVGVDTAVTDSLFHRYISGKDSDKKEIDRMLFGGTIKNEETGSNYTDYVYTFYTGKSDSKIIADVADYIRKNATYEVREETGEFEHIEAVTHEEFRLAEGEIDLSGETVYYHKIEETDENGQVTERYEPVPDVASVLDTDLYEVIVVVDEEAYDEPIYKVTKYPYDFTAADVRGATFGTAVEQRNDLVMAVIDYIIKDLGCEYTLTPDLESVNPELDGVENFLTVTKQGYCVQFASAVCLILREYGIPARYVEGYIACDFNLNKGDTAVGRFSTYVRDYEAHAWVEVFFDGIGWVQYECTPAYYAGMYGGQQSGGNNDNSSSTPPPSIKDEIEDMIGDYEKDPEEEEIDPEELLEQEQRRRTIIASIVAVVLLAIVALIVWVITTLRNRAASAQGKRDMAAETVLSEHFGQNTSEDDRRELSYTVIDALTNVLDIYGLAPEAGEFKDAYAHRLAVDLEDILGRSPEYEQPEAEADPNAPKSAPLPVSPHRMGQIMDAIAAEEFGHGMSIGEMKQVAALYRDLHANVHKRVKPGRRMVFKYIKNRL